MRSMLDPSDKGGLPIMTRAYLMHAGSISKLSNRSQQVSLSYGWLGTDQGLFESAWSQRGRFAYVTGTVRGRFRAQHRLVGRRVCISNCMKRLESAFSSVGNHEENAPSLSTHTAKTTKEIFYVRLLGLLAWGLMMSDESLKGRVFSPQMCTRKEGQTPMKWRAKDSKIDHWRVLGPRHRGTYCTRASTYYSCTQCHTIVRSVRGAFCRFVPSKDLILFFSLL